MQVELPYSFLNSLQTVKGFRENKFIEAHTLHKPVTSIRINPAKLKNAKADTLLTTWLHERVPWSTCGYYLNERPSFTLDPWFHAGAYYVQEASSMFLEQALRQCLPQNVPLRILDLCAAPGGKSTHIQSVISPRSLLVSNEVIKTRVNILTENLIKWGTGNVVVTNNDPKDFNRLPHFFDCIVVDAPCSGSGLFRKDPDAVKEWSLQSVELCSQRQQRILADVLNALKPGGILIYSTCSYSYEEDERISDWICETGDFTGIPIQISQLPGIVETFSKHSKSPGYRFYPDRLKGEGFYLSVFQKKGDAASRPHEKLKNKPVLASKAEQQVLANYLQDTIPFDFLKWKEDVLAIPNHLLQAVLYLQQNLYIKKAGINMGQLIRNQYIPSHEWALSEPMAPVLPVAEVDEQTALDYLRKNEIHINASHRGWSILQYRGLPLGLIKILPGRINNYYPAGWRILNK